MVPMIFPSLTSSLIRYRPRKSGPCRGGLEMSDELQVVVAGHVAADLESV